MTLWAIRKESEEIERKKASKKAKKNLNSLEGLMKKYKSKSTTTKLDLKDSSSCATGNQCTASSSTFNIESTEPQPSVVQSSYPVNIILPDHSTIPEHTSIPELSDNHHQ
ncbi:unnamed protein product, partial [Brenthis ino]